MSAIKRTGTGQGDDYLKNRRDSLPPREREEKEIKEGTRETNKFLRGDEEIAEIFFTAPGSSI